MRRIDEFEGLRGMMALWVVLGHVSNSLAWTVPAPLPRNLSGRSAVDVFIILSGFVITLLLLNKREPYRPYLVRRVFRLYPVYVVCLAGSVALMGVARTALQLAPATPATAGRLRMLGDGGEHLWTHLAVHLTLLHGLFDRVLDNASFALLGQAWSVSVEFQFYLIAPAVIAALWRRNVPAMLVTVAFLAGLVVVAGVSRMGSMPAHLALFALGIAYCHLWRRLGSGASGWGVWHVRLLSALVLAAGWWWMQRPSALLVWVVAAHAVLARAVADSGAAAPEAGVAWVLRSRPALWLGQISYSVYLSHMLVLYPALFALAKLGASEVTQAVALPMLVVSGTLVLSRLLYVWVERPFIGHGSRVAARFDPQPSRV